MATKKHSRSRILAEIHEMAKELDHAGFIDKKRMREYDVLCLAPVPDRSRTMRGSPRTG